MVVYFLIYLKSNELVLKEDHHRALVDTLGESLELPVRSTLVIIVNHIIR